MNIKQKFNSTLFEELFNTIDQCSYSYKRKICNLKQKESVERNILQIQMQIMIKDDEFIEFLNGFPNETLKFLEKKCELIGQIEDSHIALVSKINKCAKLVHELYTIDTRIDAPIKTFIYYKELIDKIEEEKQAKILKIKEKTELEHHSERKLDEHLVEYGEIESILSRDKSNSFRVQINEHVKDLIIPQYDFFNITAEKFDDIQYPNISLSIDKRKQLLKEFYSDPLEESKFSMESHTIEHIIPTKELKMEINPDQSLIETKIVQDLNKSLIEEQALIDQITLKEIAQPINPISVKLNKKATK